MASIFEPSLDKVLNTNNTLATLKSKPITNEDRIENVRLIKTNLFSSVINTQFLIYQKIVEL